MAAWEYAKVVVSKTWELENPGDPNSSYKQREVRCRFDRMDGGKHLYESILTLEKMLTELGIDGWELIGVDVERVSFRNLNGNALPHTDWREKTMWMK